MSTRFLQEAWEHRLTFLRGFDGVGLLGDSLELVVIIKDVYIYAGMFFFKYYWPLR